MTTPVDFTYAFCDEPGPTIRTFIEELPERWGRMVPLARGIVVETGRILKESGLLEDGRKQNMQGRTVGLIGCTRYGSLTTDQAFAGGVRLGAGFASPALFGYTLPNISLAEAASHFGLTGPVYAVLSPDKWFETAIAEARRLMIVSRPDYMLACSFDHLPDRLSRDDLQITFTIVH